MMTPTHKLIEAALALPEEERMAIVEVLNESLGNRQPILHSLWEVELKRRIQSLEESTSDLISSDKLEAEIQEMLLKG